LQRWSVFVDTDVVLYTCSHSAYTIFLFQTKNAAEKFTDAKRNLLQTESDAEELERRAQETAVNLVKADQQLR
jgi:hypothetical protein